MRAVILSTIIWFHVSISTAQFETLDNKLIVSAFHLRVDDVVTALREGARVDSHLKNADNAEFVDPWTGSNRLVTKYTALIALACAPRESPPPKSFPRIWETPHLIDAARREIRKDDLDFRKHIEREILLILLSHGCKINLDDGNGWTALAFAVDEGKIEMVEALLKYRADPNSKGGRFIDGPSQITPLHMAGTVEMAKLLVAYGADIHAKDSDGETPEGWHSNKFEFRVTSEGIQVLPR